MVPLNSLNVKPLTKWNIGLCKTVECYSQTIIIILTNTDLPYVHMISMEVLQECDSALWQIGELQGSELLDFQNVLEWQKFGGLSRST